MGQLGDRKRGLTSTKLNLFTLADSDNRANLAKFMNGSAASTLHCDVPRESAGKNVGLMGHEIDLGGEGLRMRVRTARRWAESSILRARRWGLARDADEAIRSGNKAIALYARAA